MNDSEIKPARWIFSEYAPELVSALERDLGLQRPAATILAARGYGESAASARRFLNPSLSDLHDPNLLQDMARAVDRLVAAIDRKEKILLYGDYDVDGTTSVVILKKALELAGASVDYFVPHRVRDGYGMRPEVMERAAQDNVRLVVSVDTGIRAGAVVQHARELGIDVIITDHHLPEDVLPPATAVVNPSRRDCGYPEKNLCGAGVAFKLVQALLARLSWPPDRVRTLTESFLKMVAIATVADVVPLTGENRIIVKRGLEGFHAVRNPGLRALLKVAGFDDGKCPTAGQVAFRIAPRINAAGRMANASDVIEMFLTPDTVRAESLATQLHELNKDRQEAEAEIVKLIESICFETPVSDRDAALVFSGAGWHKGVIGIVASRVVERYHRPVFVLSEDEETGQTSGSGRSIPTFHLLQALESMPDLFVKFGGHRQAAGLTLPTERIAEFRERLSAFAGTQLTPEDFCPTVDIEGVLSFGDVQDKSMMEVLSLGPFGHGNPAGRFAVLDVEIAGTPSLRGEKLIRIPLRQNGRTLVAKAWNAPGLMEALVPGARVDVALCIEEDAYSAERGYPGWSLTVRHVRPARSGALTYTA